MFRLSLKKKQLTTSSEIIRQTFSCEKSNLRARKGQVKRINCLKRRRREDVELNEGGGSFFGGTDYSNEVKRQEKAREMNIQQHDEVPSDTLKRIKSTFG